MKKYGFMLAFILIGHVVFAQSMDNLFTKFAKQENVTRVTVGPFLMKISSCFTKTMGVSSIEVLDFSECSTALQKELVADFKKTKDPKFETLVTVNEANEHTTVLIRAEKKMIRELIVFTTGDDQALIRIKGKIKPEDINKVVKDHGNGC